MGCYEEHVVPHNKQPHGLGQNILAPSATYKFSQSIRRNFNRKVRSNAGNMIRQLLMLNNKTRKITDKTPYIVY